MNNAPTRLDALRSAQKILIDRGWHRKWSSGDVGPLNVRSAVAVACTRLTSSPAQWYEVYLDTVHALSTHLQHGITDWEATADGRGVTALFVETIERVENNDIGTRAGRRADRGTAAGPRQA